MQAFYCLATLKKNPKLQDKNLNGKSGFEAKVYTIDHDHGTFHYYTNYGD